MQVVAVDVAVPLDVVGSAAALVPVSVVSAAGATPVEAGLVSGSAAAGVGSFLAGALRVFIN